MKNKALGALVILLIVGCSHSSVDRKGDLEQLLAANADARGGAMRFDELQALQLKVHIKEPSFEVTGTYSATVDGYVRVDVYMGEQRVFSEAIGPDGGWQWPGGGQKVTPLSTEGEAALRRGWVSNLFALYAWPAHGYSLSLDTDAANVQPVLLATEASGFTRRLWLDPRSHLVMRVYEVSALHPDMDDTKVEQYSTVREWMSVDGVLIPRVTEKIDNATGDVIQRSTVRSAMLHFAGAVAPGWVQADHFLSPDFPQD